MFLHVTKPHIYFCHGRWLVKEFWPDRAHTAEDMTFWMHSATLNNFAWRYAHDRDIVRLSNDISDGNGVPTSGTMPVSE